MRIPAGSPLLRQGYAAAALAITAPALALAYLAWPGFIDYDAVGMLRQAEWHWADTYFPLLLTYLWGWLIKPFGAHPGPILVTQCLLLAISAYLTVRCVSGSRWLALLAPLCILSWPPVSGYGTALVKDVWFGLAATLSLLALFKALRSGSWPSASVSRGGHRQVRHCRCAHPRRCLLWQSRPTSSAPPW